MSMSFDPAGDFDTFDGLEPVTLWSESKSPIAVSGALRRHDASSAGEPGDADYTLRDAVWHLPVAQVAAAPSIGDVITDGAGVRFVIQSVERAEHTGRWLCRARSLALVAGLNARVVLQQGEFSKGASGDQQVTWRDVRVNLAAQIQPQQIEMMIEYDRRVTRVTHRILLAEEVAIDHTCRIVAGANVYRILGCERPQRIDALQVILAAQTSGEAS